MTRTRPASSWAKVRSGCVGQDSVPARPWQAHGADAERARRRARSRAGAAPRSTQRSQLRARRKPSSEPANRSVTSALLDRDRSAAREAAAVQLVAQRAAGSPAAPPRRARAAAPSRACGTPLISTRRPPRDRDVDVLAAGADARRARGRCERHTRPISRIASSTSSGVRRSGPVTVSISGMPSRSVRQTIRWPWSDTSRQESSSTLTCVIGELAPAERAAGR